jgi:bacteriorhodopsin
MAETADVDLQFVVLAIYGVVCLVGGMVPALTSRWGWFVFGFITAGLVWPFTALLVARPDSPWGRSFYGPPKMARARKRFR